MNVSLSIFGPSFKAYEFLLEAKELPSTIDLWDPDEEQLSCAGFTLVFTESAALGEFPKSLGRFLLHNKSLLLSNAFYCKQTEKEITVSITPKELELQSKQTMTTIYSLQPGLMRLLGELKITLYIVVVD